MGQGPLQQAAQVGAHHGVGKQHGLGARQQGGDAVGNAGEQLLGAAGLQGQVAAAVRLLDTALQGLLQAGVQDQDAQVAGLREVGAGEHPAQGLAHVLGDEADVLGHGRRVGGGLQDPAQVPHGDPLPQEVVHHLLERGHRDHVGDEVVHQARGGLLQGVQQVLHLGATQQLRGVLLDQLGQVGGEDCGRFHHGVAQHLGPVPLGIRDPVGGQAEGGLGSGGAGELLRGGAGVHGQELGGLQVGAGDLLAPQ